MPKELNKNVGLAEDMAPQVPSCKSTASSLDDLDVITIFESAIAGIRHTPFPDTAMYRNGEI